MVCAAADGYLPALADGSPLRVPVAGTYLRIVLTPGAGRVAGAVVDALGGPVTGASVSARVAFAGAGSVRLPIATRSDSVGAFALWLPKEPTQIEARADGYAPARVARTPGVSGLKLVLIPSARISGRTLAATSGKPLPGVRVSARSQELWHDAPFTFSDETGRFELDALRSGVYRLEASAPGYRAVSPLLELAVAEVMHDVELTLERAVTVDALVLGAEDAPGCGAGSSVQLTARAGARSRMEPAGIDSSGHVHWDAVPSGRYHAAIRCSASANPPLQALEVGDANLSGVIWRVEPGRKLTIWAVDARGTPAAGVPLELQQQSAVAESAPLATRQAISDEAGRVVLEGLAAGVFVIRSALLRNPVPVELSASEQAQEVRLQLLDGGWIEVAVRASASESADGVRVYALGSSGRPWGAESALSDGRARIGPLPAGHYRVFARDGLHARVAGTTPSGQQWIALAGGQLVKVEVSLPERRGRIRGRVHDPEGRPIGSARITAHPADDARDPIVSRMLSFDAQLEGRYALSADDGSFELQGLSERETFTVEARRPFHGSAQQHGARAGDWIELTLAPPNLEASRR